MDIKRKETARIAWEEAKTRGLDRLLRRAALPMQADMKLERDGFAAMIK